MRKISWLAALALFVASPVAAQTATQAEETVRAERVAPPAATIAERLALPPEAGLLLAPIAAEEPAIEMPVMRRVSGRGTALAIVGGALFVAGLIAGDDAGTIMVISGAAIGAWGLYLMFTP